MDSFIDKTGSERMTTTHKKAVMVFGPTASGKTALGILLSRWLQGEVVNADSRQIYTGMPIITAMPTAEEFAAVPHHLYNFLPPEAPYSVTDYLAAARAQYHTLCAQGKTPVFVGGTGFYLKVLEEGLSPVPQVPVAVVEELNRVALAHGTAYLARELQQNDPQTAHHIDLNNRQRVVRALAVWRSSGQSLWALQQQPKEGGLGEVFVKIALMPEREVLHQRIAARFDVMVQNGVVEEARRVFAHHDGATNNAVTSIGLKDFFDYYRGEIDLAEAKRRNYYAQRQYAKRQVTWLRQHYAPHVVVQGPVLSDETRAVVAQHLGLE